MAKKAKEVKEVKEEKPVEKAEEKVEAKPIVKKSKVHETVVKTSFNMVVRSDGVLVQQGGNASKGIKCSTPVKITIESC